MKKIVALALALCMMAALAVGSAEATKLTAWTFIAQHQEYYEGMAEKWNALHPDEQIEIEVTTLGYDDMHNKMKVALQSDQGAPDACDVELGQFPNILAYSDKLVELDSYIEPLKDDIVEARLQIYSKDGHYYGMPLHVGAMVAYYRVDLMEKAGVDYTAIKTWDDWYEAGLKVKEATGAWMGTVETSTQWVATLMLGQQGTDWQKDGEVLVNTEAVAKVVDTQKKWLEAGIAEVCPGGQPDTEEGKAYIANNDIACVIMPFSYMSRFTGEIGEVRANQYAVAPCPVFEEGQIRSVGAGGTGTVIYKNGANADLAARFFTYAKISDEGNRYVWDVLGFDPVNKAVWEDEALMKNEDNAFNKYFVGYPVDALLQIKDEIGAMISNEISPTISSYLGSTLWNEVYVDGVDTAEALEAAQDAIESDLF